MSAPQDSTREIGTCEFLGLKHNPRNRSGEADAFDEDGNEFELKSTTAESVTTARDWGFNHLERERGRFWIVVKVEPKPPWTYMEMYFCHPLWLEPFFSETEIILNENADFQNEMGDCYVRAYGGMPQRQRRLFDRNYKRCIGINCPPLDMSLVRRVGKCLYVQPPPILGAKPDQDRLDAMEMLKALVRDNPIKRKVPTLFPANKFQPLEPDEEQPMEIDFD